MRFKRLIFFSSIVLALIIVVFILFNNRSDIAVFSPSNNKSDNTHLSLLEAYDFGLTVAQKEDNTAALIHMNSVDDGTNSGLDGKRARWNLIFALPEKKKTMIVVLLNGKVKTSEVWDEEAKEDVIKRDEIAMDSNEAVRKAQKRSGIKSGNIQNFFHGYHFKLLKEDNKVFFGVVGVNEEGNLRDIYFNARNGEFYGGNTH